eukprot:SAG31_NODE_350_length_17241_cov_156.139715_12_plen_591_part_00
MPKRRKIRVVDVETRTVLPATAIFAPAAAAVVPSMLQAKTRGRQRKRKAKRAMQPGRTHECAEAAKKSAKDAVPQVVQNDVHRVKVSVPTLPTTDATAVGGLETRAASQQALEWLLSPMDPDIFFQQYWEQKPLLVRRSDSNTGYYGDLFSRDAIDQLLKNGNLSYEKDVDITSYTDGKRSNVNGTGTVLSSSAWQVCSRILSVTSKHNDITSLRPHHPLNLDTVRAPTLQAFERGCSIRLLCPHAHSKNVWQLLTDLESSFGSFVGSNSYLTPAGSQGFAPHYDDIEAFVLQLEGKKQWQVYQPRSEQETLPRFASADFDPSEIGEPVLSVTLKPGDLLYFPRGWIHQARSCDDDISLHLTVSTALRNTFSDLLQLLLPVALELSTETDVEFRRSLPADLREYMGVMNSEDDGVGDELQSHESLRGHMRAQFMSKIRTLLERLVTSEHLPIDAAIDQMIRSNLRARLPPIFPEQGMEQITTPKAPADTTAIMDLTVRLVRHDVAHIAVEENSLLIYHSAGNTCRYKEVEEGAISVDVCVAPAIEHLFHAYPSWTDVKELPVEDEDAMEAVVSTVQQLMRAGVLVVNHQC